MAIRVVLARIAGAASLALLASLAGCAQLGAVGELTGNNFDRAEDLGLIVGQPPAQPREVPPVGERPTPSLPPTLYTLAQYPLPDFTLSQRNRFTEEWMARSDFLCRRYKDRIIRASRDSRLSADLASTLLSTLATIFTPVNTVRALAGAAAVTTGLGAVVQTDAFNSQAGEIIASAIQTARENQANEIERNLLGNDEKAYNIFRAERDVIQYHNMCSLETALLQIRVSLRATSPDGGLTPPAAQGRQHSGGVSAIVASEVSRADKFGPGDPKPLLQRPTVNEQPLGATTVAERAMSRSDVRRIQRALGVASSGDFDIPTRAGITEFQTAIQAGAPMPGFIQNTGERSALLRLGPMPPDFKSPYERFRYGDAFGRPEGTRIRTLQTQLGLPAAQQSDSFTPETRQRIMDLRALAPALPNGDFVDSKLAARLPPL